jgi:DNA-binding MarR family transcriptional regulator
MANVAPDDRELELLLTQLMRMVSPALAADDAGGKSHGGLGVMDDLRALDPAATQSAAQAEPATTSTQAYEPLPALSPSEARALIELVSARGIAQGELAAVLGLDKSTVSRLAAGLERKGWIRRGRDEGNQRYVRLYLTPQGGDVAARVWRAWQSRQARILAGLSADERAGLSAGLGGLVRVLAAEGLLSESAGTGT